MQESKRRTLEQPDTQPDDEIVGALTSLDISGGAKTGAGSAATTQPDFVAPPPPKVDLEDRTLWPEPGSFRSSASADILKTRRHCPLACCDESKEANGKGWAHAKEFVHFMRSHARGELVGKVPPGWLHEFQKTICLHCNNLISNKHGPDDNVYCPRCAWARRMRKSVRTSGRQVHPKAPSLATVCMSRASTRRSVPVAARAGQLGTLLERRFDSG